MKETNGWTPLNHAAQYGDTDLVVSLIDSGADIRAVADPALIGASIELPTLTGHESFVYSVAYSPDGKRLATASSDGTIPTVLGTK